MARTVVRQRHCRPAGFEHDAVNDVEQGTRWTGFHKIEQGLWVKGSTKGLEPIADKLLADVKRLQAKTTGLTYQPEELANGANGLLDEVSASKITGEEDRYSHTDLWDFAANIAGSEKVIELLTPALQAEDPELLKEIQASFAEVDAGLARYATPDGGYQSFDALTEEDATALKASLAELSEELAEVPGALGLK